MAVKELPEIKLFMSHVCPYCPQAKKLLDEIKPQLEGKANIKEYSTLTPKGRAEALRLHVLSIPQIAVGDEVIVRGLPRNSVELLESINKALMKR